MSVDFITADWPVDGIVAGTTTRLGGVSTAAFASLNLAAHVGDDESAVAENRRRLRASLELSADPLWLNQVHGSTVVFGDAAAAQDSPPTADAIVSSDGRDVLGILTADCLPILLCSRDCDELAAIHAGWRSLSSDIVADTIAAMASKPADLLAWFGPAISRPAFEVGDDVRDVFVAGVEDAAACFVQNQRGRWQADLYALARRYLRAAGVDRVYGGGHCTHTDQRRFFSYRRDGRCGRMATIIFRPSQQRPSP